MRLKKLILPLLGLFVLNTAFAGFPQEKDIIIEPDSTSQPCSLRGLKSDFEFSSFKDPKIKHTLGDYADKTYQYYDLAKIALTSPNEEERDKVTVLLGLCAKKCKTCKGYRTKKYYYNLLQLAGYFGNETLADYLVNKLGWNINDGFGKTGDTPLSLASGSGKMEKEAVEKFVEVWGADVNIRNHESKTPAMVAKEEAESATGREKQILLSIFKYLEAKTSTSAEVINTMIQDATSRAVKYALTDKESIAKAIAKIADAPIFRDGMKWFNLDFDNLI
jgi:hypothetical protein